MPAYNAATTLEKTVKDIPQGFADEVILVDDSSQDDYGKNSQKHRFDSHGPSWKYGLWCESKNLLRWGASSWWRRFVIMISSDYSIWIVPFPPYLRASSKRVFATSSWFSCWTRKECLDSGMPLYKYLSNRFLTILRKPDNRSEPFRVAYGLSSLFKKSG